MRDILDDLARRWAAGEQAALATVVATFRSAPRLPGAAMVVGADGQVAGSVSGGCVETAVYELGRQVLGGGEPVLQRYGISDDDAFAVGLTCGGILDVFVERVDRAGYPQLGAVAGDIAAARPVAVATLIDHPDPSRVGRRLVVRPGGEMADGDAEPESRAAPDSEEEAVVASVSAPLGSSSGSPGCSVQLTGTGTLGSERLDDAVRDDALGLLAAGRSATLTYGPEGERRGEGARVFVAAYAPPPRLIVFGAIDFAAAMARVGALLGYRVTVCDARPLFATTARFDAAHEVVVDWPHRYLAAEAAAGRIDARSALCVLTHDPKFDVPLLEVALRLPEVGYIGAMGSRRTHDDRLERLREAGVTEDQVARLSSPIGLDLGARTPDETAISIAAEIIALRWGGSGDRLTRTVGPIHHSDE